ncbi:MAG: nucleoside hydrolase [Chloroflexi bacterium]|nr:nucleoside hydrolase [Chloroflexota bacterium]
MRPFVIDTDTATDDAVALVMALTSSDIHVEAITVVAGNVGLEQTVQNALYTVELCGKPVPVYAGADRPLQAKLYTADIVHGKDGLGDIGLPLYGRLPAKGHAVDALLAAANKFRGELTLVTLGPLTNIALAIYLDPSFASKVKRCVVMGGAPDGVGNTTATAEFNIYVDPEAARIVVRSGMPVELVGWDMTLQHAMLTPAENQAIRAHDTERSRFVADIQRPVLALWERLYGHPMVCLPDPLAMAVALDPSIARMQRVALDVEVTGELTRGMTIVDRRPEVPPANASVTTFVDRDRFIAMLHESVR